MNVYFRPGTYLGFRKGGGAVGTRDAKGIEGIVWEILEFSGNCTFWYILCAFEQNFNL